MVLKEAYRYQNYLSSMITKTEAYLSERANVTTTVRTHMRKKANPAAEDEVETMQRPTEFADERITPMVVVDFLMDLIKEKNSLTEEICKAKKAAELDIDLAVMNNKVLQNVAGILEYMSNMQAKETQGTEYDFKFNENGDQVRYSYNTKDVTTIDFDRKKVKALHKKLTSEADKTSGQIDVLNVTLNVNHEPKYDLTDSFEDCLETFLG